MSDALGALAAARDMNGVVVTVVANNGELIVNGMATVQQGSRIESMFKRLAGGTLVSAWFDSPGA